MYLGRARERGSRAAAPAISSGVLSLNPTSDLFSAVSCKSLEAGIALQSPCPVSAGRAGDSMWRWKKRDKAGDGGREGREKGEKIIKAQRSLLSYLSVCCSLWWEQDETLPGEEGGRNVAEKLVCRGDCRKNAMVERGELLTERNGRRAREQHRRQKVFKKKRVIRKKKGRE